MKNENKITKEFYEKIKLYMGNFSSEELIKWRNQLIDSGNLDNQLLELFNEELLNRACNEIKDHSSK